MNPIFLTDGYKLDHRRQYPKGTTRVYANWTPRGTRITGVKGVTYFGEQVLTKKYFEEAFGEFFNHSRARAEARYARRINSYLGPNTIGTSHIGALHELGFLPVEIRSVPEGTAVPLRVPMMTIENTHDDFFWVVNYLETLISCVMWQPCTSATSALRLRQLLDARAKETGTAAEFVPWQGHDFSFRGLCGPEAAALSGAAHLLAFTGTDTLCALDLIEDYYGGFPDDYPLGGSVAATEHSVMCAGEQENELKTFERLLDLYPTGIVSVVSDTWDLWHVITRILPQLKDRVLARDGKLVIRPDSGDPADILCGDPKAPAGSPAAKGVIELLWEIFGGTQTDTGYILLDSHIGAIYGDSITYDRANEIMTRLARKHFASGNVVLGVGSFSYQYVTRDTHGFALKSTWTEILGRAIDIFKKPLTDDGTKFSAKGRLAVFDDNGTLELINQASAAQEAVSVLQPSWRDGRRIRHESFDVIRARAGRSIGAGA